jgi:hypothetical protein
MSSESRGEPWLRGIRAARISAVWRLHLIHVAAIPAADNFTLAQAPRCHHIVKLRREGITGFLNCCASQEIMSPRNVRTLKIANDRIQFGENLANVQLIRTE